MTIAIIGTVIFLFLVGVAAMDATVIDSSAQDFEEVENSVVKRKRDNIESRYFDTYTQKGIFLDSDMTIKRGEVKTINDVDFDKLEDMTDKDIDYLYHKFNARRDDPNDIRQLEKSIIREEYFRRA